MSQLLVDTADARLAEALTELAGLVVDAGGSLHPALRVVDRNGTLSLHLDGDGGTLTNADDAPLIVLPENILVPVDDVVWGTDPNHLTVAVGDPMHSDAQARALALMVEIYEITGKMAWAQRGLPQLALTDRPEILRAIGRLGVNVDLPSRSVADVFIGSRLAGFDLGGRRRTVLMPLADLLNHHRQGAPLRITDGALVLPPVRPWGTSECANSYGGRRHPIDMGWTYGFVDESAVHARSLPVTVTCPVPLAGITTVEVAARPTRPKHVLDPPAVEIVGDRLLLSHMTFDVTHPDRLVVFVTMALSALSQRQGQDVSDVAEWARRLLDVIVAANDDVLTDVTSVLDMVAGENQDEDPDRPSAVTVLAQAVRRHRHLILTAHSA